VKKVMLERDFTCFKMKIVSSEVELMRFEVMSDGVSRRVDVKKVM